MQSNDGFYKIKYLKYKVKYLELANSLKSITGGYDNLKSYEGYINFLDTMYKHVLSNEKDKEIFTEVKDTSPQLHDCIESIDETIKASNNVFITSVNNSVKTKFLYIDKNFKQIAIKKCEVCKVTCQEFISAELKAMLLYSKLVVYEICNSFVGFLGIATDCTFGKPGRHIMNTSNEKESLSITSDDDESLLIMTYVKNSKPISLSVLLDARQLFEYMYAMICSIHYFGFIVGDRQPNNLLSFTDIPVVFNINDKRLHFKSNNSLCVVDYQAIIQIPNKQTIDLSDNKVFIQQYCNPETKSFVNSLLWKGSLDNILGKLLEVYSRDYLLVQENDITTCRQLTYITNPNHFLTE